MPGEEAAPEPRAVHNQVLRTLKEEGEMDSLRRDEGPGGQLANERYSKRKPPAEGEGEGEKKEQDEAPVGVKVAKAVGKKVAEGVEQTVEATVVGG